MGAHAEVARRGGHGSALATRGVPCMRPSCTAMIVESLRPDHGRLHSGCPPGLTNLFRDLPAYRIGPQEPHHMAR